jgi:septal ring factor EnvC (AmiA/AmiB activator)
MTRSGCVTHICCLLFLHGVSCIAPSCAISFGQDMHDAKKQTKKALENVEGSLEEQQQELEKTHEMLQNHKSQLRVRIL